MEEKKSQYSRSQFTTIIVLLCVIGFTFIYMFSGSAAPSATPEAQTAPATPEAQTAPSVTDLPVGYSGYLLLTNNPSGVILAGASKENSDQLMKLVLADDTVGMQKMVEDGEVYELDPNTQVKIIDATYAPEGLYQVRIISGSYYSQSAWVSGEFISQTATTGAASSTSAK